MNIQNPSKKFLFVIVIISLTISACSLPSGGGQAGNATATPTLVSNSNNPPATSAGTPVNQIESTVPPQASAAIKQIVDPCALFTNQQVEPIVGTALITTTPGSDIDDVTGGPLNFCTYNGDDVGLVISITESSAVKDSAEWQDQLTAITEAETTPIAEAGLGDQAYWVVTENSAGWFVAQYPYIFGLAVGGNIGYSEDYKEDLRALAQIVIDALP